MTGRGDALLLYGGAVMVFAAVLLAVLGATDGALLRPGGRIRRRLSPYIQSGRAAQVRRRQATVLGNNPVARHAVELAGRVVRRRDFEAGLTRRLQAGGVPLRPAEWLIVHVAVAVALPLLLGASTGNVAAGLLGLVVGVLLPVGYLARQEARRTAAFLAQLPDVLQLLAGSLSAGYSFPQAVDAVVREGMQPVAGEFGRAIVQARLGVPIEDALESIAERMGSRDFAWAVMAVRIQREVGGNLAEVLATVAGTLRERDRLRRQVHALSAEGRLSAYILFALPPVFAGYLLVVRGSYLSVLYTDPLGIALLVMMAGLLTIGAVWLRRIVRVEV